MLTVDESLYILFVPLNCIDPVPRMADDATTVQRIELAWSSTCPGSCKLGKFQTEVYEDLNSVLTNHMKALFS